MKRALLIVLVLMIISTVWCQNGTPTVLSAQIDVPGGEASDLVVIGNYGYIASCDFLTKYDLSSKEILWSQAFPVSYANGSGKGMFKTLDNHLVVTYDGIVTKCRLKMTTLWQVTLPGRVALTLDSVRNRVVCYSWTGLLTVLNLDNGQTLLQQQMPFEGLVGSAYHNAVAIGGNEFILIDNTIYGVNWNTAVLVSKVSINSGVVNVFWQHSFPDLSNCKGEIISGNSFYVTAREVNPPNSKMFFFEDLGDSFTIADSIDVGGDANVFLDNTKNIGQNLLTVGGLLVGSDPNGEDGHQAVFTIYDSAGETRTSQVNSQTDFTMYQCLSIDEDHIYTILIVQDYCYGPRTFYLTELTDIYNSAVSIDPDTPVTPQLNLVCYPTPTRVGNNVNVRFESKSRDNVTIEVYNIKGQKVRTLVNQNFSAGQHQTIWNGKAEDNSPVSSGMYFFRMRSGSFTATRKVILMK